MRRSNDFLDYLINIFEPFLDWLMEYVLVEDETYEEEIEMTRVMSDPR